MKIRTLKEAGGALLVVLTTGAILGVTLGSYLKYTGTQTRSVMHSQAWNAAIPVAEAGIEEALAHINASTIGTNFAINDWTVVSNQFQRSATVNGGRYTVRISRDTWPIITSIGYTSDGRSTNESSRVVQVTTTKYATGMKGLVARGDVVMNDTTVIDSFDSEDPRYSTLGRYDAAKRKDGGYVASVNGDVDASIVYGSVGTGPTGTAEGTVGDFGWVASNTGIQPGKYANDVNLAFPVVQAPWGGGAIPLTTALGMTVTLTNFQYWSTMMTTTNIPTAPPPSSPVTTNYAGTNTIPYPGYPTGVPSNLIRTNTLEIVEKKNLPEPPPGSYIGSIVERAQYRYYTAITGYSYPTVTYTYSMTATNSSTTTEWYTYVLTLTNNYQVTDLHMTGSNERILVLGNCALYITGEWVMGGSSQLIIAPGASLKIYVAGRVDLAGGGLANYTLDASKLSLFGLPSCTSIEIEGNASYTGIIYAPQAHIALNGGGTDTYDVVGAIIGNTAELNGHFQFHYDEALGRARIQTKYNVASWREL